MPLRPDCAFPLRTKGLLWPFSRGKGGERPGLRTGIAHEQAEHPCANRPPASLSPNLLPQLNMRSEAASSRPRVRVAFGQASTLPPRYAGAWREGLVLSIWVLLAVLGAAFLHALWNALIKVGASRLGAMVILSVAEVPIGLTVALSNGPIAPAAWPWVIAAGCTHFFYKTFLVFAYDRGDLSRVYPLARGAAPLAVALFGAVFLSDAISGAQYAGVALLACGIALMARGVFTDGESRRLIPFALGSAAATATYTLLDGLGARISGNAVTYVAWVFVADGLIFTLGSLLWRGPGVIPREARAWVVGSFASLASYGAYAISIWAMTVAPIAVVAALRETSSLFAVLIGWLVFGERMTRDKAVAAALIVAGVIVTRL